MTGTGSRRRLALSTVTLAVLAVTACSAPDPLEEAQEQVNGAGAALRQAGSATIQFDVTITADPGTAWVAWEGTTRARYGDPVATDTEFTSVKVVRPSVGGSSSDLVSLREVVIGDTRYHYSEDLTTVRGKPWVKLAEGESLQYGLDVADPDLGLTDAQLWLGMLERVDAAAAVTAQTKREENIDGVQTRMYNLTCNLGEECTNNDLPARFNQLFPGDKPMRIAFWLDDEGRPRKLELDGFLGNTVDGTTQRGYNLRGVMTFTGFGEQVEVTQPPADQVTTEPPVLND
jgi:hypothetical protein